MAASRTVYNSSVPNAKQKIKDKLKDYGPTDDPLTLAVNVYNLGVFNPEIDGHNVLFGKDGIWNGSRSGLAAVLFFSNTYSYAVPSTEACLFVNPTLNPDDLPEDLAGHRQSRGSARTELTHRVEIAHRLQAERRWRWTGAV